MKKISTIGSISGYLLNKIIVPISDINNPVRKDVVISMSELTRHFSVV